jgi:DNA-binding NarL/FixJ family response regulator
VGASTILRPRADWVRILDAVYAPVADDSAWARGVVEGMRGVFHSCDGIGLLVAELDPECRHARILTNIGVGVGATIAAATYDLASFGPTVCRAFFYPPTMCTTHSEIERANIPGVTEVLQSHRSAFGVVESLGIIGHPDPDIAMVFYLVLPQRCSPSKHERRLLSQVGLHLESALRLRRRPETLKAVVTLDASHVERMPGTPPAAILSAQARMIEAARVGTAHPDHEAALGLWTALVSGRYSFLPRTENGQRRYLVLENAPHSQAIRILSRRELDVLSMVARGMSTKLVAYGLGLSPATVSSSLLRAASKLGLATRIELLRLAATITGDPRARAMPATLTSAESAILALLQEGMSNQQIAHVRSRSVRTIANQVASLLRKTESSSRRALVADGSPRRTFVAGLSGDDEAPSP